MSVYTGYEPARSCTGSASIGARALMAWFLGAYGGQGGRNLGIYNCRNVAGSSMTSLHGEGRATDLGVPVGAPWAQALADRLVECSAELGIQCVIYNRHIWSGSYPLAGWRPYNGRNAHVDHLHVELSWSSARTLTAADVQNILVGAPAPAPAPVPAPAPAPLPPPGRSMLRRGSTGGEVRAVQTRLRTRYPLYAKHVTSDGIFGPKTEAAVREFQRRSGLAVDGIVGPRTRAALGL